MAARTERISAISIEGSGDGQSGWLISAAISETAQPSNVSRAAFTSGGTPRPASSSSSRRIFVWEMRLPASRESRERRRLTGTHRPRAAPEMGES